MNTKAFNKLRKLTHLPIASLSAFKKYCPINLNASTAEQIERLYNASNGRLCERCLASATCEVFKTK